MDLQKDQDTIEFHYKESHIVKDPNILYQDVVRFSILAGISKAILHPKDELIRGSMHYHISRRDDISLNLIELMQDYQLILRLQLGLTGAIEKGAANTYRQLRRGRTRGLISYSGDDQTFNRMESRQHIVDFIEEFKLNLHLLSIPEEMAIEELRKRNFNLLTQDILNQITDPKNKLESADIQEFLIRNNVSEKFRILDFFKKRLTLLPKNSENYNANRREVYSLFKFLVNKFDLDEQGSNTNQTEDKIALLNMVDVKELLFENLDPSANSYFVTILFDKDEKVANHLLNQLYSKTKSGLNYQRSPAFIKAIKNLTRLRFADRYSTYDQVPDITVITSQFEVNEFIKIIKYLRKIKTGSYSFDSLQEQAEFFLDQWIYEAIERLGKNPYSKEVSSIVREVLLLNTSLNTRMKAKVFFAEIIKRSKVEQQLLQTDLNDFIKSYKNFDNFNKPARSLALELLNSNDDIRNGCLFWAINNPLLLKDLSGELTLRFNEALKKGLFTDAQVQKLIYNNNLKPHSEFDPLALIKHYRGFVTEKSIVGLRCSNIF